MQANQAEAPLILTIDAGTSSVRVMLFDRSGQPIPGVLAHERYVTYTTAEGASEDNSDEMLARIGRCIDQALTQAGSLADKIGGVAVDTLVSNIIAIDDAGKPLTSLITYADTRNAEDAATLLRQLDERAVHERTGCMLRTSYWPARLAWLRRTQPEVWKKTARWITLGEYLELRFFGKSRVSFSAASWSGLLNRHTLSWDEPLLEVLHLTPDHLSPLVDVNEPLHGLASPYAERWPALRSVPWFPAIGDGAAANVGSGCLDHSRIALTIGTSGAMRVTMTEIPTVPAGLWCYRIDRRHLLLGGATSEGGNVYAWMQQTLHLDEQSAVEKQLETMPPDGHGLTILPFFAGERSPGWAGDVRATVTGLSLHTRPIDILQAALEAVAFRFALIQQRICEQQECQHQFVASGGGLLNSPAWMRIMADVLGRPVIASIEPEATSRGAALLALEALGALPSIDAIPAADGKVYHPKAAHYQRYQEAIKRQQELYDLLITGHALADR
jgi:gluconokinase